MTLSKSIVRLTFLIAFLTGAFFHVGASRAQQDLGIAAVVNDDVISMLDLANRVTMVIEATNMNNDQETRARVGPQVLRGLIDEKLKQQEAKRIGIQVTQDEIGMGLAQIAKQNDLTIVQLEQKLAGMGVPFSALQQRLDAEISWQIFVNRRLARTILVGEEEITDEINRINANAGRPEYLLAEIFLPVDKPGRDTEIRQLAERMLMQMRQGAAFNLLASNFSRAPSAAVGGDMGWVQPNLLDDQLQRALAALKPGQVTPPVRALGGYYLMLMRDSRTSPGLGGGDAFIKLSQLHMMPSTPNDQAALNAVAQNLIAMSQGMTNCAQLEAAAPRTGSPLSGPVGEVKLSTLPPNMQGALAPLGVGQMTPPMPSADGLATLMVCARENEPVDQEKIRNEIADKLSKQRLSVTAQRRLRDLRRDAFVDIRL
ncbi:peptidylprolyl isomerase [Pseudomonadota bacterium]